MKLIKIVLFLLALCLIIQAQAPVIIDIDPDDLQQLSEILAQYYVERGNDRRISQMNSVTNLCKKTVFCVIQMIGIMFSLVGANILTEIVLNSRNVAPVKIENATRKCEYEFGCTHNMCWRTCDVTKTDEATFSWCYTIADCSTRNFQACLEPNDCSPCWSCFGPCNVQPKVWGFVHNCKKCSIQNKKINHVCLCFHSQEKSIVLRCAENGRLNGQLNFLKQTIGREKKVQAERKKIHEFVLSTKKSFYWWN